jgi:hypothetical protein
MFSSENLEGRSHFVSLARIEDDNGGIELKRDVKISAGFSGLGGWVQRRVS